MLTATFFIVFLLKARKITGQPENQLGSRGLPRCHDDHNPNCGLVGMTSRYVALSAAPRRVCQPGNSAGACHLMRMR
jgi:hypothetical protein